MEAHGYFPMFVDISRKRVLVVGAGRIALRRVRTLLQFTGNITVVAPGALPELEELERDGSIALLRRQYRSEDARGADMVLAATDSPEADLRVWSDCRELKIPVNVASDRTKCDFYFPGVARKGGLVVGVTAGGEDHSAAKKLTGAVRELLDRLE